MLPQKQKKIKEFTFYYIYINTESPMSGLDSGSSFTFYYIYINTRR